jgi:tryptophan 7-halogenase
VKSVSIIGKGTAGCLAYLNVSQIQKLNKDLSLKIDWYYNSKEDPQSVGEGTTPVFTSTLAESGVLVDNHQMYKLDARPKLGIEYINWGNTDYVHPFYLGRHGVHFNASKFQDLIFNEYTDHTNVTLIDKNVKHSDIDADIIIDCSGKPDSLDNYDIPKYIPVNAVNIHQCSWKEEPKYLYTKTIARPWGWVFVIPLTTRCSVGYLYNKDITPLESIEEDIQEVIYDLDIKSKHSRSFHFDNYVRKHIFEDRALYVGNSGFFLEPMEATTLDAVSRALQSVEHKLYCNDNALYNDHMKYFFQEVERFIMMHYAAGSRWKNEFWSFAQERGRLALEERFSPRIDYNSYFTGYSWDVNRKGLGLSD